MDFQHEFAKALAVTKAYDIRQNDGYIIVGVDYSIGRDFSAECEMGTAADGSITVLNMRVFRAEIDLPAGEFLTLGRSGLIK